MTSYHRGWDLSRSPVSPHWLHPMDRYMELDLTESVEPSCQMLSACQLQCQWCNCCNWHATKRHRMTLWGPWFAGLVPSLPSEPGRDDTERFEPRTELRHAMCSIEEITEAARGCPVYEWWPVCLKLRWLRFIQVRGAASTRVWTSLAMMSLDAVLTYRMTHKLRTSQCVKMTAWEASEDVETSNLGSRWISAKDLMIQSPEDPEAFPQWAPGVNMDPIDSNTSQEIRID